MRVLTVIGNRPQFVKAAAVSFRLREAAEEVLVHTGQHYDAELSQVFFDELELPRPEHLLELGGGTNTEQTGRMLGALAPLLTAERPDVVFVYGDTNSTLAGALAAAQMRIPVAHVEAGMRSFDRAMPEELNRVLADHASDLFFCPPPPAVDTPAAENIRHNVHLVGDTMADVALSFLPVAEERSTALDDNGVAPGEYLLMTVHRAGNVDLPERLERVVDLAERLPLPAVFPVHPRTRARLRAARLQQRPQGPPAGHAPPRRP